MKAITKATSILLCICMLITILTVYVSAAEQQTAGSEKELWTTGVSDVVSNDHDCTEDSQFYDGEEFSDFLEVNEDVVLYENVVQIDDDAEKIKSSIISEDVFSLNGYVESGTELVSIDEYYDFSKIDKYQIAEWTYQIGALSESDAVECLCDLIIGRNFDNIDCLEGVFDRINTYRNQHQNDISLELANKINEVMNPIGLSAQEDGVAVAAISSESTYSNSYFTVHYDNTKDTYAEAKEVANYFVTIRNLYANMGFEMPILETGETRYHVYLDPAADADGTAAASTFKTDYSGNKCASYIYLYSFTTLDTETKEDIAHEFFHAIQNAYNHDSGWFKEACANWGSITTSGSSTKAVWFINEFVDSPASMTLDAGYGATVFPLAIHYKFGGSNAILSIYNEYSTWSSTNLSLTQIREVVTNGISDAGYSGGFDLAYRAMASYLYRPNVWYDDVFAGGANIVNNRVITKSTVSTKVTSFSDSVDYLASDYFTIALPSNVSAASVKVDITFGNSNGRVQRYKVTNDGTHWVSYNSASSNASSFTEVDVGNTITTLGFVVSNLSSTESMSYSVKITVMPKAENMTVSGITDSRYTERMVYLDAGETAEFNITFGSSGTKLIQTFGTKDTVMELYSSSGALLVSDECDDAGYRLNSLLSYYFSAGVQYTLKVRYYSSATSGVCKLALTPSYGAREGDADSIETYENIKTVTGYTGYTWETFAVKNYTRVITFTAPYADDYTFEISSDFDTYLYVIDPRSTEFIVSGTDYNDDAGESLNAMLSRELETNVPYLVIYSGFNLSNDNHTGDLTLDISRN